MSAIKKVRRTLGMLAAAMLCVTAIFAQTDGVPKPVFAPLQTFYLTNISQPNEANEILTTIRNMLTPSSKVYLASNENAIFVLVTPDQLPLVQKIINDLDHPRKTYRLTYTINESDGGKRIGTQHFALIVVSGQRTTLKQGSRVPVATTPTQFTYFDIGLNFDATLDESVNGIRLRTKAEQSSIAEGSSSASPQNPVVRQTVLEGTAILTPGKPLVLGSLDIPGSTRHQDVEVVMEVVK